MYEKLKRYQSKSQVHCFSFLANFISTALYFKVSVLRQLMRFVGL